jgi:hypothetical protein
VHVRIIQATGDRPTFVVMDGGPLDGIQYPEIEGNELDIVMSDGQQHRYIRTENTQKLPDGPLVQVFTWAGRYFGPK